MDFTPFYTQPPQQFSLGFPPTPHPEFDSESPPNAYGFDFQQGYDPVTGLQTPVSTGNGIAKAATGFDMDMDGVEQAGRGRSSSEEKELTPAQSQRRKEQNRQAQRAFRERKEKAFKDLELKLAAIEASSSNIMTENEILRNQLQKYQTENEILRATTNMNANAIATANQNKSNDASTEVAVGPLQYNPTDFYDNLLQSHTNKTPSHRIVFSPTTGARLLGAGATWELVVNHPLYAQGLVDVANVIDRLKNQAKCDGQGPVYEESAIHDAIRDSAASGRDEL